MDHKLSKEARNELLEALRNRYRGSSREGKALILDQVMELANCHRKHAIRLLASPNRGSSAPADGHQRIYDEAVRR
jgi:phage portal protein BeeE